ncbi:hypothetical protein V8F20_003513 [Naviculisporaceae sp. PSN 640]
MAVRYAKDLPASTSNHIEKVAVVGAGGNVGKPITKALLATGKHTVTALTRAGSTSSLPKGVKVAEIDYDNEESIVNALNGQDYLVITMSVLAPPDNHHKLVAAAAKAGIKYIMPNVYGYVSLDNEELNKSTLVGPTYVAGIKDVEAHGAKWTGVTCSFWYEYSLAAGPNYFGFDIPSRTATLYSPSGQTRINTTTHPQVGRAVASFLSLPIYPTSPTETSPTISKWFNKPLHISSFYISQREMLDSIQRVTGTSDADWTIKYADPTESYHEGLRILGEGGPNARVGFGKALYARIFMPDADPLRTVEGIVNEELGLPKEDLDDFTRLALGLVDDEALRRKIESYESVRRT